MPLTVQVALTGHRATLTTATQVVVDTVGIGVSSSSNNAANSELLTFVDQVFHYNVSTAGLALSDFNAGNLHLWIGVSASPSSAFVGGNFSLSTGPSNQTLQANGPTTLNQAYTTTVNYIGTPPGPSYVVLSVDSFAQGEGTPIVPPTANYSGTASADDGQGGVDAGAIQNPAGLPNPPASRASTTTASHAVTLTLGSGSLVITPVCTVSVTPTGSVDALCQTGINSVTVVPPDPATAFLSGATLSFIPIAPSGVTPFFPPFSFGAQ